MQILVVGDIDQFEEVKAKFGNGHNYISLEDSDDLKGAEADVIFDFVAEEIPESLENYEDTQCPIFFSSAKSCLAIQHIYHPLKDNWFGFNGMPTFINRALLEVTLRDGNGSEDVEKVCHTLGTDFAIVDDRVGMISPRVICMIINEAYYTFGEGTAEKDSIDLAMKLGTNYPLGPFEWAEKIGIDNVYELLEAVYEDTKDERYKIAPELKKEYLRSIV